MVAAPVATATPSAAGSGAGQTYYLDSANGSDSDSGTSPDHAWRSLGKVDTTTFRPGDQILLKSGSSWTGQLRPKGSGTASAPITVGAYGSGAKPAIKGAGRVADAVRLWNQQYWTLTDLDVSNTAPATSIPGANLGDFRGIRVGGDNGAQLHGFTIDGVDVHDVTGVVNWIGGSTSGNKPGITFQTGWDRSKNTGGIVFEPWVANPAAPGASATTLHDITVENSTVRNTSFAGIVFKQYTGNDSGAVKTGWGTRTGSGDTAFAPNTDIEVRNNYITQTGTPYGANGIYITGSRNAVIEDNVIDHVGTCGIESYYTDQVTIQHNEVFGTSVKAGGSDSNAIDTDIGTTGQIVQYNYSADNGEGFLVFQQQFGDSIWRYNVVVNNSKDAWHISNAKSAHGQIYGNTAYDTVGHAVVGSTGGSYTMTDNIFASTTGSATTDTTGLAYHNNLYYGTHVPAGDTHPVTGNPLFVNPAHVKDPSGTPRTTPDLQLADGYALRPGSPAINTGVAITGNGGYDYAGRHLYNGAPDIGAFEY